LVAAPFMVLAAWAQSRPVLFGALLLAQFFVFFNNGPLNAAVVNSVPPGFRTFAYGINTMLLHLFGDAASPTLIGALADRQTLGFAIVVNAAPVALGGLVLLLGLKAFRAPRAAVAPPLA
jgi:MFS transporter, Spinster family, sphingosine-1-phosphate transporter